jgi:replicative DNA helicase
MPVYIQDNHLPHSIESEEAVLGAILIDPPSYHVIAKVLRGDDFYIHRHRIIWEAITRLQENGTPVDFLTLCEELDRSGKLAEVGGQAFLTGLINLVPSSLHAEAYAQIIKQAAVRRQMLATASKVARLAYKEDTTLEKVVNESVKEIFAVRDQLPSRRIDPFSRVLELLYTQVGQDIQGQASTGVATGFCELDNLLQGLQPSDLVVVAGRPGMGKTSFLLSVTRHTASVQQKNVLVFTLETSREQLSLRLLAQETGIEAARIRRGKLDKREWQSFTQAIESLKSLHLFLDDTPAISIPQMLATCRRLYLEKRLDLVVVDYLQLLSGGERFENRVQEVSFVTRQLKALARELNVPVLAAAQLSRAVEQRADKHPLLSDLRESGSIEMDADMVLFIYQAEDYGANNQVDIIVAKQRNGPTGTVRLEFHKPLALFSDPKRE